MQARCRNAARVALALLTCWFLAGVFRVRSRAGFGQEHPVPLDKNVDSAKCLECHEDKTQGQGGPLRDRHGMSELPRSSRQQRHHPHQAHHLDAAGALPHLPRRQRRGDAQGDGASAGGARLHQVPRSAHHRQQESVAESRLSGDKERESLPQLPQAGIERPRERQPPCRARHGLRHLPHHPQDRAKRAKRSSIFI